MKQAAGIDEIGMPVWRNDFVDVTAEALRVAAKVAAAEFPGVEVSLASRTDPQSEEVTLVVRRSLSRS